MKINVNNLSYNFDGNTTTGATVGFYGNEGGSYINASIMLTVDDLGDNRTFDDVTMKELTEIARPKLDELILSEKEGIKE